ncbi:MAG: DNA polymerase III subunit gamma/tau [Xanthomonadales bacterium]|nr:DNA polymerase III subunit gamma/tau [Xanthomonadales bacterium]
MSYQVLARKWRPHTFSDLVGQEHVVQALVNGLDQDRVHHAFLLTGTRGVGKTTIARILAKCLNCEQGVSSTPCGECGSCIDVDEGRFVDMLEIDAASKTKVDDTRELLETVQYTPSRGRYKVYIIDEVHMLSGHSFNALLKTLEEPPPHVKFVLATTDPQKLPITILSRCLRFSLTRLLPDQISGHLVKILQAESIPAEDSAIMRIARAADGSMRDGLSLLDQAIAYGGGELKDADVASMLGSIDHAHIAAIIDALSRSDASALMTIVNELVQQSRNLETALDELAEAMHRIALIQAAPDFRDPVRDDWDSLVERSTQVSPEDAQLYYQIAITGRRDLGLAPDPRTGLEMTLLRMLAFKPADTASGVTIAAKRPAVVSSRPDSQPQTAQASHKKASAGGNEAAKAARAAFDALQKAKPAKTPALPEPEVKPKPDSEAGREMKSESRLPERAELEPELPLMPEPEVQVSADLELGQQPGLEERPQKAAVISDPAHDWSSLQNNLELSGAAREFARNIQLESADEHNWRFLVPDTLLHLGSQSVVESLQKALSDRLGHPVRLDLHKASEPLKSVAAAAHRAELDRMSEAERTIEEDPTVQDIKKEFGARVVPDSIQPLQ